MLERFFDTKEDRHVCPSHLQPIDRMNRIFLWGGRRDDIIHHGTLSSQQPSATVHHK